MWNFIIKHPAIDGIAYGCMIAMCIILPALIVYTVKVYRQKDVDCSEENY